MNEIKTIAEFRDEICENENCVNVVPDFIIGALLDTYDKDFNFEKSGVEIPECLKTDEWYSIGYLPNAWKWIHYDFDESFVNDIANKYHFNISTIRWKNRIYEVITAGWFSICKIAGLFKSVLSLDDKAISEYVSSVQSLYIQAVCCILQSIPLNGYTHEFDYIINLIESKGDEILKRPKFSKVSKTAFKNTYKPEEFLQDAFKLHTELQCDVSDLPTRCSRDYSSDMQLLKYRD